MNTVFFINGKAVDAKQENGYAVLDRDWKKGDVVEFNFEMDAQIIHANSNVKSNQDRIAIQRGPIVYCVEGADNKEGVWNLIFSDPENTGLSPVEHAILDEKVIALQTEISSASPGRQGRELKSINEE